MPSWEYTFRIENALPAVDPVARFVAVLAMIYNDWRRTMDSMAEAEDDHDGVGIRLLRFRQLVGYSHEATKFLKGCRKRYPDTVDTFVRNLHQYALDEYAKLFSLLAPVEDWAKRQRHVTFHYPVMLAPEQVEANLDPFANALAAAAHDTSSATLVPGIGMCTSTLQTPSSCTWPASSSRSRRTSSRSWCKPSARPTGRSAISCSPLYPRTSAGNRQMRLFRWARRGAQHAKRGPVGHDAAPSSVGSDSGAAISAPRINSGTRVTPMSSSPASGAASSDEP